MFNKAVFDEKVKVWLAEQIRKSVIKEVTECYDLIDGERSNQRWNIFRICKVQVNNIRSKILLAYVKLLELFVYIYSK